MDIFYEYIMTFYEYIMTFYERIIPHILKYIVTQSMNILCLLQEL